MYACRCTVHRIKTQIMGTVLNHLKLWEDMASRGEGVLPGGRGEGGSTWVLRDQGEGHGEAGMQGGQAGTQAEGQCGCGRGRGRTRRCAVCPCCRSPVE